MSQILFRKRNFYITQNFCGKSKYYTAVNDMGLGRDNPHSHLPNFALAKKVLHWGMKGTVPGKYSAFLKEAIRRMFPKEDIGEQAKEDTKEGGIYGKDIYHRRPQPRTEGGCC